MVGDNPINRERWKLHGSNEDYWRADNPFIIGWYRMGEDEYPHGSVAGEPERTDSGPRHHHLDTNQEPNTFMQHVSGIAPWSTSGIMFDGASWGAGTVNRALHVDGSYYRDRTDFSTLGYYGQGSAIPSGVTMMGWCKVTDTATATTTPRKIWGNIEDTAGGNDGEWMITITPSNRAIEFTYYGLSATSVVATTLNDPNNVTDPNQEFFFACQISKGNPASSEDIDEGSGILRIFLGTTVSGLRESAVTNIDGTRPANFWRGDNTQKGNLNEFAYTFGADPQSARGNANQRHLPPSSVIDEFIIVQDGELNLNRMQHYMNSGITQDDQDPLSLAETFAPALPGTDDLVAYWTFDEQGGANTSPNTPSFTNLDMFLTGVSFVDGVRGGSGIRPNFLVGNYDGFTYPTVSRNGLPHVPAGSGLNFLFPDRDMTWIGWVRTEGVVSHGGNVGFWGTSDRHVATYFATYIFNAGVGGIPASLDMGITPSGGLFERTASISAISAVGTPNDARGMNAGDWHLLGIVFDITHGFTRVVLDAQDVYPMHMLLSSGITKEHMAALGLDAAGFAFGNVNGSDRPSFDDWAVYERVLSLPEMSGYALSGIEITPINSPISTQLKRTVGWWKLDELTSFDPDNIDGVRYDDDSWYRHHLTALSGGFEQGDSLNTRIGTNSASVTQSGSTAAIAGTDSSSNLDFSTSGVWASSGFAAGCWMYVPSGDLQTQGNGSSGLAGDHMFMGVWGQSEDEQSWLLGMRDDTFFARVKIPGLPGSQIQTTSGIPFNTPFFVGMKVVPSGSNTVVEIFRSEDPDDPSDLQLVGREVGLTTTNSLDGGGVSGFSLLNASNLDYGFPSGTRIQGAFVFAGGLGLTETDIGLIKVAGVDDVPLTSGGVSIVDPANVSHWRFDEQGDQFRDWGRAQNFVRPVNIDGNKAGTFPAIHTSGVIIRQQEWYDTAFNPETSGLDLAADNKSWTWLSWVLPNAIAPSNEAVIMGKGGPQSGIEIYMPTNTTLPSVRASGDNSQAYNGGLLPAQWNHLAVVYDRDNDEFATIINGRYAGTHTNPLLGVPPNASGMAIGGRGDQELAPLFGGTQFSGIMDDTMIFSRALSLPEISGLAANTYNFVENLGPASGAPIGGYISGIGIEIVSGLIGLWMHGSAQELELVAGYVSGVSGAIGQHGGFIHGKAFVSEVHGGWLHGAGLTSGTFGYFLYGLDIVSGFIGSYQFGACQGISEFDVTLNFNIVSFLDFDARLGVEKTRIYDFDARLGVIRITAPPECTLEMPLIGEIASGIPYTLTVQGSGIAQDGKDLKKVRFTFADFKGAELGTLVSGEPNSGLYEASRVLDTSGWYTVKIEALDSFGYRTSCCRPFLLIPSGVPSGTYLAQLPSLQLSATPTNGSTIQRVFFEHTITDLDTTSGVLEYTDFADEQEILVNSLEMPSGSKIFTSGTREHDYTMPGLYCSVWSVSGEWGIVSDTISLGVDFQL